MEGSKDKVRSLYSAGYRSSSHPVRLNNIPKRRKEKKLNAKVDNNLMFQGLIYRKFFGKQKIYFLKVQLFS